MQPLLRHLFEIGEAITASAEASPDTPGGRDIRWTVESSKNAARPTIRLEIRRGEKRIFEHSYSREQLELWLGDPECAASLGAAIRYMACRPHPAMRAVRVAAPTNSLP